LISWVSKFTRSAAAAELCVRRRRRDAVDAIAGALVYAVVYLNLRGEDGDETYLDADVKALEGIGGFLRHATPEEQDALAAAADAELAKERAASRPRPEFVEGYRDWMEHTFGDGWAGIRRVPAVE
jgi:hypothetical protein